MARAMVTRLGYSDELGLVAYGENQEEVFLGMSVGRQQNISESTAQKIDAEVRRLVDEGYRTARTILTERGDAFKVVAEALLEFETLTGDEIKDLIAGKRPVREPTDEPPTPRSSPVPTTNKPRPPQPDAGGLEPQPSA
jgi:cell division protease FtsH